jgi:hypothetical protein
MRAKAAALDTALGASLWKCRNPGKVNATFKTDINGTPGKVVLQSAIPITECLWHDARQIL